MVPPESRGGKGADTRPFKKEGVACQTRYPTGSGLCRSCLKQPVKGWCPKIIVQLVKIIALSTELPTGSFFLKLLLNLLIKNKKI